MLSAAQVDALLEQMAADLRSRLRNPQQPPVLVGLATGGVWLAQRLGRRMGPDAETGTLDISFYRDDYRSRGLQTPQPSRLPLSLEGRQVILVDDILHTGRTVRAALNALFELGRPAQVLLAVLVDRGGRELPVQPDVTGTQTDVPAGKRLRLQGPDRLQVVVEAAA